MWYLDFIQAIIEKIVQFPEMELNAIVIEAYDESLGPHHDKII